MFIQLPNPANKKVLSSGSYRGAPFFGAALHRLPSLIGFCFDDPHVISVCCLVFSRDTQVLNGKGRAFREPAAVCSNSATFCSGSQRSKGEGYPKLA